MVTFYSMNNVLTEYSFACYSLWSRTTSKERATTAALPFLTGMVANEPPNSLANVSLRCLNSTPISKPTSWAQSRKVSRLSKSLIILSPWLSEPIINSPFRLSLCLTGTKKSKVSANSELHSTTGTLHVSVLSSLVWTAFDFIDLNRVSSYILLCCSLYSTSKIDKAVQKCTVPMRKMVRTLT